MFQATLMRTYRKRSIVRNSMACDPWTKSWPATKPRGYFGPKHWFLAWKDAQPVAVAMLDEVPDIGVWDLSYLGVVPEARRRGLGRELATHLLHTLKAAAPKLMLAVDERNRPAIQLYENLALYPWKVAMFTSTSGRVHLPIPRPKPSATCDAVNPDNYKRLKFSDNCQKSAECWFVPRQLKAPRFHRQVFHANLGDLFSQKSAVAENHCELMTPDDYEDSHVDARQRKKTLASPCLRYLE